MKTNSLQVNDMKKMLHLNYQAQFYCKAKRTLSKAITTTLRHSAFPSSNPAEQLKSQPGDGLEQSKESPSSGKTDSVKASTLKVEAK